MCARGGRGVAALLLALSDKALVACLWFITADDVTRKNALAQGKPGKAMLVMLQEMCMFTRNAGEIFFAPLSKTKLENSSVILSVMVRKDRYDIGLQRY